MYERVNNRGANVVDIECPECETELEVPVDMPTAAVPMESFADEPVDAGNPTQ